MQEYRGWTADILNLSLEEDIFKLFTLAINWNTNISWEIGLATFEILNEEGFLTTKKLRDSPYVEAVKQRINDWSFKNVLNLHIQGIQKRPYAKTRVTFGDPRSTWVDAYHIAALNWDKIGRWMRIDEIVKGRKPQIDGNELIRNLQSLIRMSVNGKTRSMLKVKAFLICRELNCQDVADINSEYCCVPDIRVREQMKILGFPVSYDYFQNSTMIARYFKRLYDLPLFYFFEECKQYRKNECHDCRAKELCSKQI